MIVKCQEMHLENPQNKPIGREECCDEDLLVQAPAGSVGGRNK